MRARNLTYDTSGSPFTDITRDVAAFVSEASGDGLVNVFVPHATAGLACIETGSGSEGDLEDALGRLLPRDDRYRHSHGSPGHGADHVLPAFLSPSLTVPVAGGEMALGTWQSIVLVDLNRDNPRRTVRLSLLEG
jgi:secondary thiamine-phosphate synthase enzyme